MSRLIIIGGGGHGAVVAEAAIQSKKWISVGFLDDQIDAGSLVVERPILGNSDSLDKFIDAETQFVVAIGNNQIRDETLSVIQSLGGVITSVFHPAAIISPSSSIMPGTAICGGAVINARAVIGRGAIVNTSATIDHDCVLGAAVHLSPGVHLAGSVNIGDRTWIGIGAVVKDGITIGEDCVIGAGAAVIENVASGQTVLGVPARPMEKPC